MRFFSFAEIQNEVIRWAEARKIIPRSTPIAQARKSAEETTELVEAAAEIRAFQKIKAIAPELADLPLFQSAEAQALKAYKDAVGDVMVTLVNGCALADVDPVECFADAYNEIKDRKGTLLPNGIFQKEA